LTAADRLISDRPGTAFAQGLGLTQKLFDLGLQRLPPGRSGLLLCRGRSRRLDRGHALHRRLRGLDLCAKLIDHPHQHHNDDRQDFEKVVPAGG
jgi:hypothetical protein